MDGRQPPPINECAGSHAQRLLLPLAESCEGNIKDAQFTAGVWSKGMEQVGPDKVFCFIADGASVNIAAAKIFEEK